MSTVSLLLRRLGLLTLLLFVCAVQPARANDAQDGTDKRWLWVWFPTAECPEPVKGRGATPDDAIKIEKFVDLYSSAAEQLDKETSAEPDQSDAEAEHADLNCRWVKISGHFRIAGYYHYRGVLAASSRELYLNGGPGNFIRDRLYFIENWDDTTTSSLALNGSDVTIVGRFYDLCRAARVAEQKAGEDWFIMGGPCHYGELTGLMIRDARVLASSEPYQRLRGEGNRNVVGDLSIISRSWPEYDAVLDAAQKWVRTVRKGADHYYRDSASRYSRGKEEDDEYLRLTLADKDDWIWFLAESPNSPILRKRPKLENQQFALFRHGDYRNESDLSDLTSVTACFCVSRDCAEKWPLLQSDSKDFFDAFVCTTLGRDRDDKSLWTW